MKWKRWKLGLIIASVLASFSALAAMSTGGSLANILSVLGMSLLTNWGAFLKDHPVDSIDFETSLINKNEKIIQ